MQSDRSPSLVSRSRDSDSRKPLRLTRDYASQRPLRRRNRKRRASRVSLRAEPSDHGTPSLVSNEVRGVTGRASSHRRCSLLRAPGIWFAPDRLFAARSVRSPVSVQTGWSFSTSRFLASPCFRTLYTRPLRVSVAGSVIWECRTHLLRGKGTLRNLPRVPLGAFHGNWKVEDGQTSKALTFPWPLRDLE